MPTRHAYTFKPGQPTPGLHNLLRPLIASWRGTGILTCFPSATPFGLALGADSPCADERGAGNLGLAASGLFTRFNATHVSIRTSDTSSGPLDPPSQAYGTLPYHSSAPFSSLFSPTVCGALRAVRVGQGCRRPSRRQTNQTAIELENASRMAREAVAELKGALESASSATSLSPVTSSAREDSTSELLRFL